jgi:LacI family gluconate utilization system Gnt-I transcriptional repressor
MTNKEIPKKSRRGSGAITLSDVAKLAGVAPITASRALNTPNVVSSDVLQRVQEAVAKTGYVPNRMAGGLASSKSKLIAAVVPSTVSSVFMETIERLNDALFDAGYQLMLGQTGYSDEREEQLLEAIIGRRPDGIFLTGIMKPGKGRTRLVASGIPIVETWDLTPTPVDMLIGFSHPAIGQSVASYLIKKGHKHFAVISGDDERADRRLKSFCAEVAAHGLNEVFIVKVGSARTLKQGRIALSQILQDAPLTDAVFCSSDLLAMGAMTQARAQNLHVPEQIAVVGFGDAPFVSDMIPALTTVRINGGEIGQMAARFLIDRAQGLDVDPRVVDVGFSIIERDSA